MTDPVLEKIRRAIENKKGILRKDVVGATIESFPLFRCPGCNGVGDIDLDQFMGKISIQCTNCDYHETKDWSEETSW